MTTKIYLRDPFDKDKRFAPLLHQHKFAVCKAEEVFMGGGWGSAKSAALVYNGMYAAYYMCPPGVPGGFVMPRFDMMRRFLYEHFIPMCGHLIVGQNKVERYYDLVDNRRIYVFSGHDPEYLEGPNLGWLNMDEAGLMRPMIFQKAVARVRHPKAYKTRLSIAGIPLWGWLQKTFEGRYDKKRVHMKAKTSDNPYLPKDYIERLKAAIPSRMLEQYINGEFVSPGAGVYYMFNPDTHIFDWVWMPTVNDHMGVNRSCIPDCGVIIDPSARTPHVLFVQILRKGYMMTHERNEAYRLEHDVMMIYDELYPGVGGEAISAADLWGQIHAKGWPIDWILVDKAAKGVESTSGKSFVQITRTITGKTCKMVTKHALTLIKNGIEMTRARLGYTTEHPWVFFSKRLERNSHDRAILKAINLYRYPETKDGKVVSDEPIKDGVVDHAMDCLRYGVVHFFPIYDLIGETWDSERY